MSLCSRLVLPSAVLSLALATAASAWPGPAPAPPSRAERSSRLLLPRVDVERLLREDAANAVLELPQRVGEALAVDLSPATSGAWEELAGGDSMWRLEVTSAGARWLVLGFARLELGPDAWLHVRDGRGTVAFGPHRAADATADGRLWLPPIAGETALIELFWPAPLRTLRPVVQLTTVARGYRPAWGSPQAVEHSGAGAAGDCNVDVGCPLGDEWQDEKRGVVQLLIAGSRLCSGSLVNTTARDCRPYVLTAAHCLKQSTDAAATLFRFGYERPLCENGDAPTGSVLYGATLRATHPASDFALLELDQLPPAAFDAYYAGWNRATTPAAESWCVHHAGGGPKKISHDANAAVSGSSTGWGTSHWRVQDWEDGTTAPGSSGAPLLDPKGRIVGQLHGGTADCAGGWDEFGKLAHSWGGGGSSGSRLSDWLDPLGSGTLAIDGLDGSACRREVGSAAPRPRPLVHGREVRASRRPAPR